DNRAIEGALRRASELRAKGLPTVPWTLEEDCAVNPFLRFDRPSIAGGRTPVESFAALRKAKDQF
ncbi:MAG: hydroxyacylglutathione hydrolase, partial [Myxococcales bacterium]|nr:hydroxyacylglutathione hydrolase [Myxococcales bacterium]